MNKRIIMIIGIVLSIGMFAAVAMACPWDGNWGGWGWGSGSGYTANQGATYQAFMNDTASLREKIAAKHGEYNALMAQQNPDPKRAAQLQGEIANLNNQIQQKAQKYNVSARGNYGGMGNNMNWHRGYCNHMGCW